MIPVVLSGGNGSRLWPLSRQMFPKQFIPLVGRHTLFQQTLLRLPWKQLKRPMIICNQQHRFIVAEQLSAINQEALAVLLEPFGRNTAPAIAIAAMQLLATTGDELMLVLPADHIISNIVAFHKALDVAAEAADSGNLVMFGVTPNKPETGYGYIQRKDTTVADGLADGVYRVARFVEKPNHDKAAEFLASGDFYWNSGMFLFRASRYLEELLAHAPDIYHTCKLALQESSRENRSVSIDPAAFEHCPDNSIDYAVMEHTQHACLVPLDAEWSDVGAWSALWEVQDKDAQGNFERGDTLLQGANNCYVHATDRLVTLLGVENLVVIETKDAVMIANKDQVQNVKTLVGALNERCRGETVTHREVYRPWGAYDSIDMGKRFQVKRITVKPGASLSLQKHHHRSEHWIVVSGTARVTSNEKVFLLGENESTYIPVGAVHRLENPGKISLEMIEVQSGSYLGEDDIVRLEDVYGRREAVVEVSNTAIRVAK